MIEYKDEVRDEIISYFANCETRFNDEAKEIVSSYQSEWDSLPCDDEGATVEQDKAMDDLIDEVLQDLMDAGDIWINNYRFDYDDKTEDYKEYDGTVVNAPDRDVAWLLFSDISGEYGMPDCEDYTCVEL